MRIGVARNAIGANSCAPKMNALVSDGVCPTLPRVKRAELVVAYKSARIE